MKYYYVLVADIDLDLLKIIEGSVLFRIFFPLQLECLAGMNSF